MQPGDVLFVDGFLIHGSKPNRSAHRYRRAFVAHYLAAASTANVPHRAHVPLHNRAR